MERERIEGAQRVRPADWAIASLDAWSARVGAAIDDAIKAPVWLVAHSFGVASRRWRRCQQRSGTASPACCWWHPPTRNASDHGAADQRWLVGPQTTDLKDTITALLPHRRL